ncbi:CDI toxin immunity protein [Kitasatospora purpeofusca]|uniref:CDI toxin immunity protein n=1 Tax=Kitasatospora purpeofusca TaxID=67352 RepID=UPI003F635755
MYGTHAEPLARVLEAVGDSAMLLSYEEDRAFAALSLGRFPSVGSSRLDWDGAEVIERCEAFDSGQLNRMVRAYAGAGELAVVFWSNLAVPSVAMEAALVAEHADEVLEVSPECWIYLTDSKVLVEFQDGKGLTVGQVPN